VSPLVGSLRVLFFMCGYSCLFFFIFNLFKRVSHHFLLVRLRGFIYKEAVKTALRKIDLVVVDFTCVGHYVIQIYLFYLA
jgi:hypothetical protein